MVRGILTSLNRKVDKEIEEFYISLRNEFTDKELQNTIYAQAWIVIILTIFFNVDLLCKMFILGEDTSMGLLVMNILMFLCWLTVEKQYKVFKKLKK